MASLYTDQTHVNFMWFEERRTMLQSLEEAENRNMPKIK
ncbi:hypothetical protein M7I_5065 [Glarea lozoyensis 74030]|uniref:Uncharacterized protein n=1 Tax=Glarea lozoyensis (strain ATCC 74030 / MF5533) TaxID=1104152 RepID=H0EQV7_GLAL7|nr:hypothetical protein M7I_5065 [Glarea lozoyensis 74030]